MPPTLVSRGRFGVDAGGLRHRGGDAVVAAPAVGADGPRGDGVDPDAVRFEPLRQPFVRLTSAALAAP
jgi:hypothetical protein